jgi:hypothetical protein
VFSFFSIDDIYKPFKDDLIRGKTVSRSRWRIVKGVGSGARRPARATGHRDDEHVSGYAACRTAEDRDQAVESSGRSHTCPDRSGVFGTCGAESSPVPSFSAAEVESGVCRLRLTRERGA